MGLRHKVYSNTSKAKGIKPLSPFSPYRSHFYCPKCVLWIPHDGAVKDSRGRPLCPICHKNLRTKPKWSR